MVFWIADNGDTPTAGNYHIAFRHIFLGIVSALGVNVRPQQTYQLGDIRRVKDRDGINVTEGCQNFRAFVAGNSRPAFAFESPRACIRIHRDDQPAAQFFGGAQIADVADVKKIKTSIGQDDLFSSRPPLTDLLCQFRSRKYFLCSRGQLSLHYGAQQFSAGYGGCAAFHYHYASGVIG